jgi:tRNA/rRNA methyltransferase
VPVNPDFPSLNLAQAVLLMGYEFGRDILPPEPAPHLRRGEAESPADRIEIERLGDHYDDQLTQAGFFFPETKAASMRLNMRNMWSRLTLTKGDVRILHGVLRQLTRR